MIPGFIDTHIHAPQCNRSIFINLVIIHLQLDSFTGTGYDKPLLDWLSTYTFPHEQKYSSIEHAIRTYPLVVKRTLHNGTTTACYFATIHLESSLVLKNEMELYGQRGFIGKVCMDRNSPPCLTESTKDSINDTIKFVGKFDGFGLVRPCITPRFVPSCTSELMVGLADIAKKEDLLIQSHISENKAEIEWALGMHPECTSYADIYEQHGLLNSKTVMAHCIFLTDIERQVYLFTVMISFDEYY